MHRRYLHWFHSSSPGRFDPRRWMLKQQHRLHQLFTFGLGLIRQQLGRLSEWAKLVVHDHLQRRLRDHTVTAWV